MLKTKLKHKEATKILEALASGAATYDNKQVESFSLIIDAIALLESSVFSFQNKDKESFIKKFIKSVSNKIQIINSENTKKIIGAINGLSDLSNEFKIDVIKSILKIRIDNLSEKTKKNIYLSSLKEKMQDLGADIEIKKYVLKYISQEELNNLDATKIAEFGQELTVFNEMNLNDKLMLVTQPTIEIASKINIIEKLVANNLVANNIILNNGINQAIDFIAQMINSNLDFADKDKIIESILAADLNKLTDQNKHSFIIKILQKSDSYRQTLIKKKQFAKSAIEKIMIQNYVRYYKEKLDFLKELVKAAIQTYDTNQTDSEYMNTVYAIITGAFDAAAEAQPQNMKQKTITSDLINGFLLNIDYSKCTNDASNLAKKANLMAIEDAMEKDNIGDEDKSLMLYQQLNLINEIKSFSATEKFNRIKKVIEYINNNSELRDRLPEAINAIYELCSADFKQEVGLQKNIQDELQNLLIKTMKPNETETNVLELAKQKIEKVAQETIHDSNKAFLIQTVLKAKNSMKKPAKDGDNKKENEQEDLEILKSIIKNYCMNSSYELKGIKAMVEAAMLQCNNIANKKAFFIDMISSICNHGNATSAKKNKAIENFLDALKLLDLSNEKLKKALKNLYNDAENGYIDITPSELNSKVESILKNKLQFIKELSLEPKDSQKTDSIGHYDEAHKQEAYSAIKIEDEGMEDNHLSGESA